MAPSTNQFFKHLQTFSDRVCAPKLEASFMEGRVATLLRQAREDDAAFKGTTLEGMPATDMAFIIASPIDGTDFTFFDAVPGAGRERQLIATFNGNLRWLFVSCFEGFERFVKDMVLEYRTIDATILSARQWSKDPDLRQMSASELLNALRRTVPKIAVHEQTNRRNIDYRLYGMLFEHLRHCIVHAGSCVDIDAFLALIAKAHGRPKAGRPHLDKHQILRVRGFFSKRKGQALSEVTIVRASGDRLSLWDWDWYVRTLSEHAVLVFQACSQEAGLPMP